jgi:hypothetical protein
MNEDFLFILHPSSFDVLLEIVTPMFYARKRLPTE